MITIITIICVMLCFGVASIAFLAAGARAATLVSALAALTVIFILQHGAGIPALADGRLAAEQWRLLAVAPLENDRFLVSVRYAGGDIRSYTLHIADPAARDAFLKAAQALKKGRPMLGHARHGRAGLANDSAMEFEFKDAPDLQPKDPRP